MKRHGFTLLEVIAAMAIFLIGVIGIIPLFISNVKYNESVQKRLIAHKVLEDHVADLRSLKTAYFTKDNLESKGFTVGQPSGYPSVPSDCPPGYEYVMYKGYELIKQVSDSNVKYKFTLKLCVDDDYLKPYLKRAILWIYWIDRGRSHNIRTEVFITEE